jgi:hypothetical protein
MPNLWFFWPSSIPLNRIFVMKSIA